MTPIFVLTRQFLQFNDNNTKCLEIKKTNSLRHRPPLKKVLCFSKPQTNSPMPPSPMG